MGVIVGYKILLGHVCFSCAVQFVSIC